MFSSQPALTSTAMFAARGHQCRDQREVEEQHAVAAAVRDTLDGMRCRPGSVRRR